MSRTVLFSSVPAVHLTVCTILLADGGFFCELGQAEDIAQTRQEVLIAFYEAPVETDSNGEAVAHATYVIRSHYEGDPGELAWVIPLPATPEDVLDHDSIRTFSALDEAGSNVMKIRPNSVAADVPGSLPAGAQGFAIGRHGGRTLRGLSLTS